MFKRYKPPYEEGKQSEGARTATATPMRRLPSAPQETSYPMNSEPPPRAYETRPNLTAPETAAEFAPENEWQPAANSPALESEEPETTLGEGVIFKGELSFKRMLRIDGEFEGTLSSGGKLIVGPTGRVKSEKLRVREAVIEGRVESDIFAEERVELRGDAKVRGDIEAQSLSVDEGVSIVGVVTVPPATLNDSDMSLT